MREHEALIFELLFCLLLIIADATRVLTRDFEGFVGGTASGSEFCKSGVLNSLLCEF